MANKKKLTLDEIQLQDNVRRAMYTMFPSWDSDERNELCNNIIDMVCEDVIETSDYPNYNGSDISLGIKRAILACTGVCK